MAFAWERMVWRRRLRLQVELPPHEPSFATLIKLVAKNQVFITDVDLERLSYALALEPGVLTHKPGLVIIVVRTKDRSHEEQLLHTLTSFGYAYKRA